MLYTGKDTTGENEKGSPHNVALELLKQGYLNKGHSVYLDNWYAFLLVKVKLLELDLFSRSMSSFKNTLLKINLHSSFAFSIFYGCRLYFQ